MANPVHVTRTQGFIVDHCRFWHIDSNGAFSDPDTTDHSNLVYWHVSTSGAALGSDLHYRYNEAWSNSAEGIIIAPDTQGNLAGIVEERLYIYGNMWRDPISIFDKAVTYYMCQNQKYSDVRLFNNTIADLSYSIHVSCSQSDILLFNGVNNLFYQTGTPGIVTGFNWYSGTSPHGQFGDVNGGATIPFVDLAGNNLQIVTNIGATYPRNKGLAQAATFNMDAFGNMRGSDGTWDIGYHESGLNVPPSGNDTNPPVILTSNVLNRTPWAADISWTLSENASNQVRWDFDGAPYANTNINGTMTQTPSIQITNLIDNRTVHYQLVSTDASNNVATSSALTFQTATIFSNLARIEAEGGVLQGIMGSNSSGYIVQSVQTPGLSIANGGQANYWFYVGTSNEYRFTNSVNAAALSENSVWINFDAFPTNDFHIWDVTNITSGFELRDVAWRGGGDSLMPGISPVVRTFTQGFHSMHVVGREANMQMDWWGIGVSVPPGPTNDTTAPNITPGHPVVTNITANSANILFVTDEPADAIISYWVTGGETNTVTSTTLETVHVIAVLGLLENTTYNYSLTTADVWENRSPATDPATFATLPNRRIIIQGRVNISF